MQIRRLALMAISLIGIGISLYLTYVKLTNSRLLCGFGSCELVQNSEYAAVFGVPMAMLGVVFYFVLFVLAYYFIYQALKAWVIMGSLFSFYLTYLEIAVIKALCFWCVISAALVISSLLISYSYKDVTKKGEIGAS
ncbi:vitamin K epoxide reductase family protein [candidate division WWE3 bacterium]|nr:vitamin K epoxide reductase family protein [candidate division WWE3 bacterium]